MTLRELARILPGYVNLLFHTDNKGWNMSAGVVVSNEDLPEAYVVQAIPIAPYTMDVSITIKEE